MKSVFLVVASYTSDFRVFEGHLRRLRCGAEMSLRGKEDRPDFDPKRHKGVVLLGNDKGEIETSRRFKKEKRDFRIALDSQRAVLGICHGHQLIAHELGAVKPDKHSELTDYKMGPVEILPEGMTDPVLGVLKDDSRVFQEHYYRYTPPPFAVPLAMSLNRDLPHCEAFRFGKLVYGLQFHPEVTPESYS